MKFIILAPLLAALAAAAPPIAIRPMLPIDVFNVTGFSAHSTPHSTIGYIQFNITVTTISPSTSCFASVPGYQWVGNVAETNCTEPTVAFSFTRGLNESAQLDIYWRLGEKGLMQGTYEIPGTQFERQGENTSVRQVYTGPGDFSITNLTVVRGVWGN